MDNIPDFDKFSKLNKAFKIIGIRNPEKFVAILYIITVLIIIIGGIYFLFSKIQTSQKNMSQKSTDLLQQIPSNSNVAIGTSGTVTQTIITQETKPHIDSKIISVPTIGADGYYHTTYELTMWDGSQTMAPETFSYDKVFIKCLSTKFVSIQIRPSPALINSIECLSKIAPPSDGVLFWY